jgi:hypothetical protein
MTLRNRSRLEYAWLLAVVLAAVLSVGLVGWSLLTPSNSVKQHYSQLVGPAKENALALATKYALQAADRAVSGATEVHIPLGHLISLCLFCLVLFCLFYFGFCWPLWPFSTLFQSFPGSSIVFFPIPNYRFFLYIYIYFIL